MGKLECWKLDLFHRSNFPILHLFGNLPFFALSAAKNNRFRLCRLNCMILDLSGKVGLVTGGSGAIGRETCMHLAQAGARVIINYEKSQESTAKEAMEEIIRSGNNACIFRADISVPEEVHTLFEYIDRTFGRLDILVNNAGVVKDNLLMTMKLSEWDRVHDVNLRGAFLCTRHAAEMMMRNNYGKVINISSISAIRGWGRLSNYASSKGGLLAFTRASAVELARKNIQVNAVIPGFVPTELSRKAIKRAGEKILENTPAGRFGRPSDVAGLVTFLSSDMAGYITGQAISVDGGMSIS